MNSNNNPIPTGIGQYSFLVQSYRPLPSSSTTSTPIASTSTSTSNNRSISGLEELYNNSNPTNDDNDEQDSISSESSSNLPSLLESVTEQQQSEENEVEEGPLASKARREAKLKFKRSLSQLENKSCWICLDDDKPSESIWVHACNCTLIAHEECLLEWVASQETSPHCPACNSVYIIEQKNSSLLTIYKRLVKIYDISSLAIAGGSIGAGIWLSSTAYSITVLRFWLGEASSRRLLFSQSWPLSYYLKLPTLPFLLVLSRTNILDSLLPFITLALATGANYPLSLSLSMSWPPSAGLTICLLPWIRISYLAGRRKVWNWMGRKPMMGLINMLEAEEGGGDHLVAAVEVVEEGNGIGAGAGAGVGEGVMRQRVSLGRFNSLLVSTLLSPFAAAIGGAGLLYLARKNGKTALILRKVLGLSPSSLQRIIPIPSSSSSSSSTKTISSIASTIFSSLGISNFSFPKSFFPRSILSSSSSPSSSSFSPSNSIDPIWIRNSLGLGIILLIRDVVELIVGGLEDRRKKSRKVVGREFGEGLEL